MTEQSPHRPLERMKCFQETVGGILRKERENFAFPMVCSAKTVSRVVNDCSVALVMICTQILEYAIVGRYGQFKVGSSQ